MTELEKESDLYLALASFDRPAQLNELTERIGPVKASDYAQAMNKMVNDGYVEVIQGLFQIKRREPALKEIILDKLAGSNEGLALKDLTTDQKDEYRKELASLKKAGLVTTVNRRWLIA